MLREEHLRKVLKTIPALNIAVIGDLFLDRYWDIDGRLTEKSRETGLDAYQVVRVRTSAGAAGTVLNNLAALGVGRLQVVSIIGDDGEGYELRRELQRRSVRVDRLIISPERFTPTYAKPMLADGDGPARELNRLDVKNRTPTPLDLETAVLSHLQQAFAEADGVVVADQVEEADRGVVTSRVRERLAELAAAHPHKLVLADSRARIGLFRDVWLKPNRAECVRAVAESPDAPLAKLCATPTLGVGVPHLPQWNEETVCLCAEALARRSGRPVYCTLGEQGMLFTDGLATHHIPAYPVRGPIDIVGAGDSATAGIVCGLCSGMDPMAAGALGSLIASITIQQISTTGTATPEQVLARWQEVAG